jgi:hypothetical protein
MSTQLTFLDWLEKSHVDIAMMTPDEIYHSDDYTILARLTEDQRFDRKSSRINPNDLAEGLSAFGNDPYIEGGVIVVGIANDRLCRWLNINAGDAEGRGKLLPAHKTIVLAAVGIWTG